MLADDVTPSFPIIGILCVYIVKKTFQLCSDALKLFYTLLHIFSVVVKTNINKYAERWCAFI